MTSQSLRRRRRLVRADSSCTRWKQPEQTCTQHQSSQHRISPVKSAEDGTVHHRDPEHLNSRNRQGIAVIPVFHFPAVQNGPNSPGCLRKEGDLAKCPPESCALNLADLGSENGAGTNSAQHPLRAIWRLAPAPFLSLDRAPGRHRNHFCRTCWPSYRHEDFAAKHQNRLILRAELSLIRSPVESSTDHITLGCSRG